MASAIFNYVKDRNGNLGWLMQGMEKVFDSGSALVVAHDMIDHGINDSGSVADEFKALGSFSYIRLDSMATPDNPAERILSRDFIEVIGTHVFSTGEFPLIPKTKSPVLDDNEYLERVFVKALKLTVSNISQSWGFHGDPCEEQLLLDNHFEDWMKSNSCSLIALLRQGYRRANRRYQNSDIALHLFETIKDKVEDLYPEEGMSARITVYPKAEKVYVTPLSFNFY